MPRSKDNAATSENMTFDETPGAEAPTERTPVDITVAEGDKVRIRGHVVAVEDDAVTIEIDDGIEGNICRITLNSNQAAVALK